MHFVVIVFCFVILTVRLNLNNTKKFGSHGTVNMYHLQNQKVNTVYENNCCLV